MRTHLGRLKASEYFFRIEEARKDRRFWESLRSISASYRSFLCQKVTLDKLNYELDQANQKTMDLSRSLEDQITKCGLTYTTFESPDIKPDMIINCSDSATKEVRDQIILNCKL